MLNNSALSNNLMVGEASISQDVITLQVPQQLYRNNSCALSEALPDPTYKKGRLRQAPSYLLGKPLHDFDATENAVSTTSLNRC